MKPLIDEIPTTPAPAARSYGRPLVPGIRDAMVVLGLQTLQPFPLCLDQRHVFVAQLRPLTLQAMRPKDGRSDQLIRFHKRLLSILTGAGRRAFRLCGRAPARLVLRSMTAPASSEAGS
jgi:hypothetical protein